MFKTIFLKEMKDVLRDKRSITLLILLPFFLMAALTFFYDKLLTASDDTEFTLAVEENAEDQLIEKLQTSLPNVTIEKYADVQKAMNDGKVQAGIEMNGDWEEGLAKQTPVSVRVYFDPGNQESSGAWSLIQAVFANWQNEVVQERMVKSEIDPNVLDVFQVEPQTTKNEDDAMASFMLAMLIPLLIPIAIANGSYPSATELFAGEKEKKTIEALLITPVKPVKILLAKWMTISLLGIFTGVLCIGLLSGLMNFTTELKKGMVAIEHPLLFIFMGVVLISMFAIFIAELEMILSMLANSVKEAGYYITPIIGVMVLPIMFMFFLGDSHHLALYAAPVMNLFLFVQDAFNGQLSGSGLAIAIGSYLVCIAILFPVASKMFHNHRLMLGK
ncbi:ABC transporter permease [Lederbergia sp. NSJ-179]|uniref:ABC transporter permease n=1 Tax=Lederbergia sp. NSJ-179 TaxID=2931402 RepID=UPI001FD5EEF9|nr:ABC transporter permease [Lederbergia sp. NSJ-179]MCJ7841097.1 ABC transporter permease [Lederbergia sp. NSJ-179]